MIFVFSFCRAHNLLETRNFRRKIRGEKIGFRRTCETGFLQVCLYPCPNLSGVVRFKICIRRIWIKYLNKFFKIRNVKIFFIIHGWNFRIYQYLFLVVSPHCKVLLSTRLIDCWPLLGWLRRCTIVANILCPAWSRSLTWVRLQRLNIEPINPLYYCNSMIEKGF